MIGPSLIHGDVAYIPLTQGLFAKVDASDFEWLMQWKWCAAKLSGSFYATRKEPTGLARPRQRMVFMHRQVLAAPQGLEVDHKHHDTLDNRRSELRLATRSQNAANQRIRTGRSTYRGVTWSPRLSKWRVQARKGRESIQGHYDSEHEAAQAFDLAATALHGEFAILNFAE